MLFSDASDSVVLSEPSSAEAARFCDQERSVIELRSDDAHRGVMLLEDRCRALEMVARDQPLSQVLSQVAATIERQFVQCAGVVLLLQDGMVSVHGTDRCATLQALLKVGTLSRAHALGESIWADPRQISVTSLKTDSVWADARSIDVLADRDACWTAPILGSDGQMLGLLLAFHRGAPRLDAHQAHTLQEIARLATLCIEHQNTTRQLAHLVRHDALTALPNRLLFQDRIQQALALARRSNRSVALMILDVDHFKSVNDTLGHQAGDHLLQQFAQRLRSRLRESDTMARVGGDEFSIVLPEINGQPDAEFVARKLISALEAPFELVGRAIAITASIGIAVFPTDAEDPVTLQKAADAALYRVKANGRNGYGF